MSFNRGMDKEDVVHIYNGMSLGYKKEWMDLESVTQSKVSQKEKINIYQRIQVKSRKVVRVCQVSLVMSNSVQPYGPQPARLLCLWDSPGKNTRVDCNALLQGIFGPSVSFVSCIGRWVLYHQRHLGSLGISQKNGTDEPICRAETEMQTQRMDV